VTDDEMVNLGSVINSIAKQFPDCIEDDKEFDAIASIICSLGLVLVTRRRDLLFTLLETAITVASRARNDHILKN
jgi:hypothetical protein